MVWRRLRPLFTKLWQYVPIICMVGLLCMAAENNRMQWEMDRLEQRLADNTIEWGKAYAKLANKQTSSVVTSSEAQRPLAPDCKDLMFAAEQRTVDCMGRVERLQMQVNQAQREQMQQLHSASVYSASSGGDSLRIRQAASIRRLALPPRDGGVPRMDKKIWIIWGMWDNNEMPAQAKSVVERYKALNKGWELEVVDRAKGEKFVEEHYPHAVGLYQWATPVIKADLLRLMLVAKHGGYYADVDTLFKHPIEQLLSLNEFDISQHDGLFFTETELDPDQMMDSMRTPIRNGVPEIARRVANYAFFAQSGSDVMVSAVYLALYRLHRLRSLPSAARVQGEAAQGAHGGYDVLYAAGPDCLTEAVFGGESVSLFPRTILVRKDAQVRVTNHGMGTWREEGSFWKKTWDSLSEAARTGPGQ
eukprot:Hpha_TRINITY_DN24434_c0_g1::TRINITY_DN24434_c0_g1_i1::g.165695::m.165695